ncbi:nitrous oxide reductase accessory protein NosL [Dongia rigui]|uniref:Nitrous oxide reductase accessory protein NosL n=1 Tax=Dongia rigui TaxID=940149 RepID=A0ABU5E0T6_9PROT|nr:nitrous oxide reductase accessory protein NosL [Dongia rigui]MDY0873209.1 nitrous oxide reductase accessory protein NosL [Dongia rigui]
MKTFLVAGAAALMLLLAACSPEEDAALPLPLEPDANSIAYFCHMALTEHEGPKGQLFLRGQAAPVWFSSPGEVFMFLATELAQPRDLRAVYVNDMGRGSWEKPEVGAWIEADKAFYVVGSSKTGAMGEKEAVPFADKDAAVQFATQFGGHVLDFDRAKVAMNPETGS